MSETENATGWALVRSASLRKKSIDGHSEAGSIPGQPPRSITSHGDAGLEKLFKGRGQRGGEAASDTSSQQERRFASLLGGPDDERDSDHVVPQNVGHRLYYVGCGKEKERQSKLKWEREKVMLTEMAQLTQRPNITSRARNRASKGHLFSEHAMLWKKKKDQHKQELTKEMRINRSKEITGSPAINPNSSRIVEEIGYKDPVHGWEEQFAKFCAKRSAVLPPTLFTPNINANAVRPDMESGVFDRLFTESAQRRTKLKSQAIEQKKKELIDPATGKPFFEPQSLRPPEDSDGSMKGHGQGVFNWLHENSKEVQARKKDRNVGTDPDLTFSPHINSRSSVLSEKVRKPLYQSPAKKLQEDAEKAKKEKSPEKSEQREGRQSQAINLDEFFRRTARDEHVRQTRMEQLRNEKDSREKTECSFQPRLNKNSVEIFSQTNLYGVPMQSPTSYQPPSPIVHTPKTSAHTPKGAQSQQHQYSPAARHGTTNMAPMGGSAPPATAGNEPVDDYIGNFEKQMYQVLDEWRKLEEV